MCFGIGAVLWLLTYCAAWLMCSLCSRCKSTKTKKGPNRKEMVETDKYDIELEEASRTATEKGDRKERKRVECTDTFGYENDSVGNEIIVIYAVSYVDFFLLIYVIQAHKHKKKGKGKREDKYKVSEREFESRNDESELSYGPQSDGDSESSGEYTSDSHSPSSSDYDRSSYSQSASQTMQ